MATVLDYDIKFLPGVGEKRAGVLARELGIRTFGDLLYYFPFRYVDRTKLFRIGDIGPDAPAYIQVRARVTGMAYEGEGRKRRLRVFVSDGSGTADLVWFSGTKWIEKRIEAGREYIVFGRPALFRGELSFVHPEIDLVEALVNRPGGGLQGVYSTTEKLSGVQLGSKGIYKLVCNLWEQVQGHITETLPPSVVAAHGLLPLGEALRNIHFPQSQELLRQAEYRLKFEELLGIQLAILSRRVTRTTAADGFFFPRVGEFFNGFYRTKLPFELTGAQKRVVKEIRADTVTGHQMNRLLQGDVGSGKTAVAMGAMLLCAEAGWQAALMAPTELLARQHYEGMRPFFEAQGYSCGLLVGGMPAARRREALESIASGAWRVVVGTHALISRDVVYHRLGLCVTDEQHRFGVAQRTALLNKGGDGTHAPHLLVMSATPIPRSLALVLYGDLDLSVIDEMPPGRLPVNTRIVSESKREAMYGFLRDQLAAGRQAYIVCPLVEEDDEGDGEDGLKAVKAHAQELACGPLRDFRVGLTYGGQPSREKTAALADFAAGRTQVLVATTVIEVGVNVPNATVMIVEDADRYGLAQLHQLRGRVGRGSGQSWCFLMARPNDRLRALAATNDGFEVARADLEQRGPGELLGARQHGAAASLAVGNSQLLYEAARCAEELWTLSEWAPERDAVAGQARLRLQQLEERVSIS